VMHVRLAFWFDCIRTHCSARTILYMTHSGATVLRGSESFIHLLLTCASQHGPSLRGLFGVCECKGLAELLALNPDHAQRGRLCQGSGPDPEGCTGAVACHVFGCMQRVRIAVWCAVGPWVAVGSAGRVAWALLMLLRVVMTATCRW